MKDASALSREMYTTPEFIRSMNKGDVHTEFACHVRNLTPHAIKLSIPFLALENAPKMDVAAHERLRERNRRIVGATTAETQISPLAAPSPVPTPERSEIVVVPKKW